MYCMPIVKYYARWKIWCVHLYNLNFKLPNKRVITTDDFTFLSKMEFLYGWLATGLNFKVIINADTDACNQAIL